MLLEWKDFQIDLNSFNNMLKANVPHADGIVTNDTGFEIVESAPFTEDAVNTVQAYYDSLTYSGELIKMMPTEQEILKNKIMSAMDFGRNLIANCGATNIIDGMNMEQIQVIVDKTTKVHTALATGALYAALLELDLVETDEIIVTPVKIIAFKNKIEDYLQIPRSQIGGE